MEVNPFTPASVATHEQEKSVAKKDEKKPQLGVPSTAQLDLERRQGNEYVGDSELASRRTFVNPSPLGEEEYIGTDPIYQNHANDTEKPLAASKGVWKDAEDAYKESVAIPEDTDESLVVDDPGMGGKAVVADVSVPTHSDVEIGGDGVKHTNDQADETEETQSEEQGNTPAVPETPSSQTPPPAS